MSKEALYVRVGERMQFANGASLKVSRLTPKGRGVVSRVAIHEAMHAVVAKRRGVGIKIATVRPGEGYLGMVETSSFDAPTAMAAVGTGGTGHDEAIVEYSGQSASAAHEVAKDIVSENPLEVHAVASLLDRKGTVGDSEITDAMENADVEDVAVQYINPDGREHTIFREAKRGNLVLDYEEDILPKAA